MPPVKYALLNTKLLVVAFDRIWCFGTSCPSDQDRKVSCRDFRLSRSYPVPPLRNGTVISRRRAFDGFPESGEESSARPEDTFAGRQRSGNQGTFCYATTFSRPYFCCRDIWRWNTQDCDFKREYKSCPWDIEPSKTGKVSMGEWQEFSDH